MFARYLEAVLRHAVFETIEEDGTIFATIPGFDGLWANATTEAAARAELASVLEGWLLLGIAHGHPLPVVEGIDLNVREASGVA